MPRKKTLKIFSQSDFNTADRLDRIHMWMLEPTRFHLSETEERYANLLQQAYQGTFQTLQKSIAIQYIQENLLYGESWYKSNRIYEDCCELYGRFIEKNKALRRSIVVEKLYAYAALADEHGDYELAAKITKDAAMFEGLGEPDSNDFNPDDIELPELEITSDPQAFLQSPEMTEDEPDEDEDED